MKPNIKNLAAWGVGPEGDKGIVTVQFIPCWRTICVRHYNNPKGLEWKRFLHFPYVYLSIYYVFDGEYSEYYMRRVHLGVRMETLEDKQSLLCGFHPFCYNYGDPFCSLCMGNHFHYGPYNSIEILADIIVKEFWQSAFLQYQEIWWNQWEQANLKVLLASGEGYTLSDLQRFYNIPLVIHEEVSVAP